MNFEKRVKRLEIVEKEAVEIYNTVQTKGVRLAYRRLLARQRLRASRA